jgi:hypothetical protein
MHIAGVGWIAYTQGGQQQQPLQAYGPQLVRGWRWAAAVDTSIVTQQELLHIARDWNEASFWAVAAAADYVGTAGTAACAATAAVDMHMVARQQCVVACMVHTISDSNTAGSVVSLGARA